MMKLQSDFHSQMTPHISPFWIGFGVFYELYEEKLPNQIFIAMVSYIVVFIYAYMGIYTKEWVNIEFHVYV